MRKLCLILTVLYAFGANCSAQSSLNIAQNLLTGDNSTFDSGWGAWGDQGDYCGKSLDASGGPDGSQCARLTPRAGASADHNAQLKYAFNATETTTYVFRLKAKKVSGDGTIEAIMQHNSGSYEQNAFFKIDATGSWDTYEGEVTANRNDYDVIMINYGKCGEVLIDDIEFGVKTNNVAPAFTKDLKSSYTVGQDGKLTLSVKASGTPTPTYQWYSNTTNNTEGAALIDGATAASYSVPTTTQGTTYYYCVATNGQGSATSAIAGVTVTASLPPVLIADFNKIASLDGTIISPHYGSDVTTPTRDDNMYIDLIADPYNSDGKCVAVSDGNHKNQEYCTINLNLPNNVNIKDYGILAFDICYPIGSHDDDGSHEDMNYKAIPISFIYTDGSQEKTVHLKTFNTPVYPAPVWDTKMISLEPLAGIDFTGASNFQIKIGPINSNRCIYYLDNIRIKENVDDVEDYTQDDDRSDIWWKYEDETLYIKGTGPIPAYKENKTCPWESRTDVIRYVVVSEGITAVGDYSIGNSKKEVVDITLHSIPEYFGEHCLERQDKSNLTRYLHLELWDAEKPFIARTKSEHFPTSFKTAKYFRNVTSNYSTVCLPFPVAKETVDDAEVELFDFTGINKDGDQYTLAFSKHSDEMGMAAGQTYLVKKHDINGTLQNTNVTKAQFDLTPKVSTNSITDSNPEFSISMTGVFQPKVLGSNIGTEQAPKYVYGFLNEKFYMNGAKMSIRPLRGYFYGSQLKSAPAYGGAKQMPKMFNFEIVPDIVTHISSPAFIAEDFNIEEVYSPNGMKTDSLSKGLNIIRTSTGKVMKIMVK